MSDGLAEWLGLREPADFAARSAPLADALAGVLSGTERLHVLELGTGTGSNIRYLSPRLRGVQDWLAIDRDSYLLALLPARMREWADAQGYRMEERPPLVVIHGPDFECHVETRQQDLDPLDESLFELRGLVTASALLDLVSARWLERLAKQCRAANAAAFFALTYTGRSSCMPPEPEDDWIRDLLNRHQNKDKGLGGPAAGPTASALACGAFRAIGYHVELEASPWTLGGDARKLQRELIDGWAHAAREMAPDREPAIRAWRIRRLEHLARGHSRVVVEHDDLAAWPVR
jgi:hypothetical protein